MNVHDKEKHHLCNFEQGFGFLSEIELCDELWNSEQSLNFQET